MKLLLIDGNSIINRAFYGIRPLTTKDGLHTNAVYGFLTTLYRELEAEAPDAICVAFDTREKTFRHESFEEYKAHRKGMPDELAEQVPVLKEVLDFMGIPRLELAGYEADDIIGTLASVCKNQGASCIILTGDKDDLQLIDESVTVKLSLTKGGKSESILYDEEKFHEVYGFAPINLIDLKALMGDSSDNIPGVAGVGEKTAMDLITRFTTIEDIYKSIDTIDIKEAVRKKLEAGADMAKKSYELATIMKDVPIETDVSSYIKKDEDTKGLLGLFAKLEFNNFAKKLQGGIPEALIETAPTIVKVFDVTDVLRLLEENLSELFINLTEDELVFACFNNRGTAYEVNFLESGFNFGEICKTVLESDNKKIFFDTKQAVSVARELGLKIKNIEFDVSLAAYLLNPASTDEIGAIATTFAEKRYESSAAAHCQMLCDVYEILKSEIDKNELSQLYYDVEMPLALVLSEMEGLGFRIDTEALKSFGDILQKRIVILESEIYGHTGNFNINSPKQMGEILFEKLGLKHGKKTKTGYSTDAESLQNLIDEHPAIALILEFRKLAKLKSTYVDGFLKLASSEGRIHSTFNQKITQTGRISSTEPNLQNIPIREELGRELRKFFIAKEGCVLLDADYSQIELRVLAHMAGDETMINAFKNGDDIHRITASQVFNTPLAEVSGEQRSRAKAVNFGIVYGISDFSLAKDIGVFKNEAKAYINSYFETYSKVKEYLDKTVAEAKENAFVRTLMGRIRHLPEIKSSNFNVRSFGERAAMNTPIQGSAADIIKKAMVNVHHRLEKEGMKSKLILQVHDELLVEAPIDESERASIIIHEEMERAVSLSVPLEAEVKSGTNWFIAH